MFSANNFKNMKLKDFIKKLEEISKKHGGDLEVIMADDIPVVNPFFLEAEAKVVITDEE